MFKFKYPLIKSIISADIEIELNLKKLLVNSCTIMLEAGVRYYFFYNYNNVLTFVRQYY